MTAPIAILDRTATERVCVRWSSHPVPRLRGVEIVHERFDRGVWRRQCGVWVKPGELFDLVTGLDRAVRVLEHGGAA